MARNIDRDNREAERRKNQLMDAGFQLFSKYGIETVSLQKVADAADVGATTMYKYFQTKEKLLIAISAKVWGEVWQEVLVNPETSGFESFTAYQGIAFYADLIISLYRKYPELLRFSSEYKTFIGLRSIWTFWNLCEAFFIRCTSVQRLMAVSAWIFLNRSCSQQWLSRC